MQNYSIYVTEEIAKKAIEKGFEPIMASNPSYSPDKIPMTPTAEQICGWLREKRIQVSIGEAPLCDYKYRCVSYKEPKFDYSKISIGNNYEETLLRGIDYALDYV